MTNALVPIGDLEKMAQAIAASKLFGAATPEQALALMLVAQAEGLHPATAARDYHIIQGKPALKADAMLARYLASGGKVQWHDHLDTKVSATFTHPSGGSLTVDWDDERVRKAGLADKEMHKKFPRQMKRARVISEGIRATNPGVAVGIYTPEEVQDMEPEKRPRKEKDMGPAIVVQQDQSPAGGGNPAASSPPSASAGAVPVDKFEWAYNLQELAKKTNISVAAILTKAGVKKAEDLTLEDYEAACEMLKRKAK